MQWTQRRCSWEESLWSGLLNHPWTLPFCLRLLRCVSSVCYWIPRTNIASRPSFLKRFVQILVGSKICLVLWEEALVGSCASHQPAILMLSAWEPPGVRWGRKLRVFWYILRSDKREEYGMGLGAGGTWCRWAHLCLQRDVPRGGWGGPAVSAGAIGAVTLEHRSVLSTMLCTLHSLSHLIFWTASEVADTDVTLL